MAVRRILSLLCCLLLASQGMYAQELFSKAIILSAGLSSNPLLKLTPAADGNLWLIASDQESIGANRGGQIIKFSNTGVQIEGRILNSSSGKEYRVYDFVETPSGNKYALLHSEDSPLRQILFNPQLFVAQFDQNWRMTWIRRLEGGTHSLISSLTTIELLVDKSERLYCTFTTIDYHVACISAAGELLWNTTLASGGIVNGGSYTLSSSVVLNETDNELLYAFYDNTDKQTILARFDQNNGRLRSATGLKNLLIHDILLLPNGNYAVASADNTLNFAVTLAIFDPQLVLLQSWLIGAIVSKYKVHLMPGLNNTFMVQSENFPTGTDFLRIDFQGNLITNRRYIDLLETGRRVRPLTIANGQYLLTPAIPKGAISNVTALVSVDADFNLPDCQGQNICPTITAQKITVQPAKPILSDCVVSASSIDLFWTNTDAAFLDYCGETPGGTVLTAYFNTPDSVCVNAEISVDSLQNASATAVQWRITGALPASSNLKNPGTLRFTQPGTFRITQIVSSECVRDTFTRLVTVLAKPGIVLPADPVLCNQSTFDLNPQLTNSTAWAWSDNFRSLRRTINRDGLYILTAVNQGLCTVRDSIKVAFISLNAQFSSATPLCVGDSVSLSGPDNTVGTTYTWSSQPPATGWPLSGQSVTGTWNSPGNYDATLTVKKDGCVQMVTRKVVVATKPTIDLGPDLRLVAGRSLALRPQLTPADARFAWDDLATAPLNRSVREAGTYVLNAAIGSCVGTDTVRVFPALLIYPPNVFQPGSATNGLFEIFIGEANAKIISLDVYNRWGGLVYSGGEGAAWDGTIGGQTADVGVYTYVAVVWLQEGGTMTFGGDITVVR